MYRENKSKFCDHAVKEGYTMKVIEQTISLIYLENNHSKMNILDVIEILNAALSRNLLNDFIYGRVNQYIDSCRQLVPGTPKDDRQS